MKRPYLPPSIWLHDERERRRLEVVGELLLLPIKADTREVLAEIGRTLFEPLTRAVETFTELVANDPGRFVATSGDGVQYPRRATVGGAVVAEALRLALDEERESG